MNLFMNMNRVVTGHGEMDETDGKRMTIYDYYVFQSFRSGIRSFMTCLGST